MSAVVTDQFRLLNANNFVDSVFDANNSYYVFLGLSNPTEVGFGRSTTWDSTNSLNPTDNFQHLSHYRDTGICGKKISSDNVRRVIRKVEWNLNTAYDMYRHDYSDKNPTPISKSLRLYDSNYYVINSDFRVYVCIDNGSSGSNLTGGRSSYEPTSTDLAPFSAGSDGYIWKYLFTIAPSDIIKFDSTEYIVLPNNWSTSTDPEISRVRNGADSEINNNQIQKVYIENAGSGYTAGEYDILGDGSGAKVTITVDSSGSITSTTVSSKGKGYTWGVVDLKRTGTIINPAKLIPIIPPSRGHGYDIYTELGADRVLVYARFDDSTYDFPLDTKFGQVGLLKDPKEYGSTTTNYTGSTYSALYAVKLDDAYAGTPTVGEKMTQTQSSASVAKGWVASYDKNTKVLKYYRDRSLYFDNSVDQTDANNVSITSKIADFSNTASISFTSATSATVSAGFTGSSENGVNLGVTFTGGLANPEINKKTGNVVYIDNRPTVQRNVRQKEDIKIILEF